MHWSTKYIHKQEMPHSYIVICTTYNMATLVTATYVGFSGNVVECALLVCVLSQPVPPSIHAPIPTFDRFLLE